MKQIPIGLAALIAIGAIVFAMIFISGFIPEKIETYSPYDLSVPDKSVPPMPEVFPDTSHEKD